MSKVYALSGARCAYLCASPHLLETLRSITPPWAVSLPGQVAAVAALRDPMAEPWATNAAGRAGLPADLHQVKRRFRLSGRHGLVAFHHQPEDLVE